MAAEKREDDGSSWWDGWIQSAKEKTAVALEQVKKDLGEFGSTIQRDTSSVVAVSAGKIRDSMQTELPASSTTSRVKQGFSNLLSGLSESLAPKDSVNEEESCGVSSRSSQHIFDRAKARLHSMQIDLSTYTTDPDCPANVYEDWLQSFDTDKYKGDISELLVANTDVRAIYTKLVPASVSNADFWGRYFYKVHQLNQDEARRAALKERAEMTSSQTFDEEELLWDDEEDDVSVPVHTEGSSDLISVLDDVPVPVHTEGSSDLISVPDEDGIQDPSSSVNRTDEKQTKECRLVDDRGELGIEMTTTEQVCEDQREHSGLMKQGTTGEDACTELSPIGAVDHCKQEASNTDSTSTNVRLSLDKTRESVVQMSHSDGQETDNVTSKDQDENNEGLSHSSCQNDKDANRLTVQVPAPPEEISSDASVDKKISPSGSDASNKESSLSDDWERDFDDIDVTEEDLAAAALHTKTQVTANDDDDVDLDDWESWE